MATTLAPTTVEQVTDFKSGNEMAAISAKHIDFHVMGYYPITPSTEIAENLDAMRAEGEHTIVMIPADGEHGAAGICYGASTGGGRVFNATSSQGLLYSLEQLPVQSGTRFPMLLDIATRSVSAPLDIRGDHSDIYFALNAGWLIFLARDPQAVYDLNIVALRVAEHPDVQLPAIVAFDGFFTSHQKRRVEYFADPQAVRDFLGPVPERVTALDPRHPVTIGPYMNDPDLINNKYQLAIAMETAQRVVPEELAAYERLSGRRYDVLDRYRLEDAEVALFLLNSAAETAKDAADRLREEGIRAGVVSPNLIRPFPAAELREALRGVRALVVGERADSYGGHGGNLGHEVKSALKDDPDNDTLCLDRIYGLGGRDFYAEDAEALFRLALEAAEAGKVDLPYDYYGVVPRVRPPARTGLPALTPEETETGGEILVEQGPDGRLQVETPPAWRLAARPKAVAPGHSACPGCGVFPALNTFFKGLEGDIVVLYQTGCAMVVSTGYPFTSHRITYVHNLFQNGAATLSGLVEMFHERIRRGELPAGDDITFVMVTGDGGMDIGTGAAIGAAIRNHGFIVVEYDNEGYMNTGAQLSYSTPLGHMTSTSHVGPAESGKAFHHKDMPQIMAATNIPYVFTGVEGFPDDLVAKAAKAQWYAHHEGMAYGKILISCPLNWKAEDKAGVEVVQAAVDSCFFPLYEIERGKTSITYDPEAVGRRVSVEAWLRLMGKTKHLCKPGREDQLGAIEAEIERRWQRLKAMDEHPLL
ncbi:MAG TPA: transketolase C-terminal domain-containing protein [Gaiellaceae bacterium]|nr:transketolase C-terminal domain-containing protein [Gaiellaceae bacterium]